MSYEIKSVCYMCKLQWFFWNISIASKIRFVSADVMINIQNAHHVLCVWREKRVQV